MPARLGLRLLAATQALLLIGSLFLPALASAAVWTDQADYSPGSVVTISGDNSNGAGYLPGETVDVDVSGPNGYTAACSATADEAGAWSCRVTLWDSNLAWGPYTYVATGQSSGATEDGTFTDALNLQSRESTCSTETNTFTSGATVCMRATGIGGPFPKSGEFKWWAPGLNPASDAATRTQAFTSPNSNVTDSFAPTECGTWTVRVYQPAGATDPAEDTFALTGCSVATSTSISAPTITYNANGSVTVTVTATSGTPSGTVSLSVDAGTAVSKALSSGSATFTNSDIAALASPNAGDHALSASYPGHGSFAPSSTTGTLHVNKASVTATAGSGSVPYDGQMHSPSACQVTGAYTGGLDCTNSPASVGPDAGTTTISPVVSGSGQSNFEIALVDGSFTINPIDADCTIAGGTFDYDGNAHGASGSCLDLDGHELSGLDLGQSYIDVPGGTATWTFDSPSVNYNDASGAALIVINPIDATCDIAGYTGDYDGNAHGASGTCYGIGGPTDILGTLALGASFTDVPGGTAHWTFTSDSPNYKDASGSEAITINPIDADCTIVGYDVVLDGVSHTATGSCLDLDGNALSGLDLSGTTHSTVGVFTDGWTFISPSDNYNDAVGSVVDRIHYATSGMCLGSAGHQILQPINVDGTSTFKQGSTVPAKFRVCDASGHSIGTPGVVTDFRLVGITGAAAGTVNEVVDATTPDTAFRWSSSDQHWIYNISTKSLTKNKTYDYRITLNDGSYIYFSFSLK